MAESAFFGALIGVLAGVALGLLLCHGDACVTWLRDFETVIIFVLSAIGLLLGGIFGAIWGSWASGQQSEPGDRSQPG